MISKSIIKKLHSIQVELKAPKNQVNRFGGYKYRSCEDIQEAVKPLLKKYGCVLTLTDTIQMKGDRFYVTACATLIDVETGECYGSTASAREEETKKGMDKSQITGSASSYARKYALNGLFLIDDTRDADTMDNRDSGGDSVDKGTVEATAQEERKPRTPRSKEAQEWLEKDLTGEEETADGFKDIQNGEEIPFDEAEQAPAQEQPTRQRRERKRRN